MMQTITIAIQTYLSSALYCKGYFSFDTNMFILHLLGEIISPKRSKDIGSLFYPQPNNRRTAALEIFWGQVPSPILV